LRAGSGFSIELEFSLIVKCLSVQQPWAGLIISGAKTIELRTWKTNYRGQLFIHSSKKNNTIPEKQFNNVTNSLIDSDLVRGFLLGSVILEDCRSYSDQDSLEAMFDGSSKHYSWKLRSPKRLNKSVEIPGKLGLWTLELPV
jgi:activating signal cointegrator 1